jgi:hypothetical protein
MYVILSLSVIIGVLNAQLFINNNQAEGNPSSSKILDMARWSTRQLPRYTNIPGEYFLMMVRDFQTRLVRESARQNLFNYAYTTDVFIESPNRSMLGKSCNLVVLENPLTGSRSIIGTPVCTDNNLAMDWLYLRN